MSSPGTPVVRPPVIVQADVVRNVLRVEYYDRVRPEHTLAQLEFVRAQLARLKPGFTLISDLSELEAMDLDCGPHVSQLMELSLTAGIGRVIRIIPDPRKDIGFNVLSLVHYRGRVPTVTCKTRAEAARELGG